MPRILFIGFGMEPFMRGGAITYQESLLEALTARGWEVFYYTSAPRYTFRNRPHLIKWKRKEIHVIELVDPLYHYGHYYSPLLHCRQLEIDRLSMNVLEDVKPDIVHIHELQFHTASLMDNIFDKCIPVLKTMHNYFDLCPEGNLMYQGTTRCSNYNNGRHCMDCLSSLPIFFTNYKIRLGQMLPFRMYDWLHKTYLKIKRVTTDPRIAGMGRHKSVAPCRAEECRYRRQFFIDRLNRLDVIHCSASRTAEIFCDHGIARNRLKVIPLSVQRLERIKPKALRDAHYPVVFGFIGGKNFHKGYHVLMEAFSRLNQHHARLIVWGERDVDADYRNLTVEYRDTYSTAEINKVFGVVDVFVVPSTWEEIFGIIGIECRAARIPVIGSNIGGIPEWLVDGKSGFLVSPDNPGELAASMGRFVDNPALISEMQRLITPWKRFDDHVKEMVELYSVIMENKEGTK